jgi:alpha-ketoglutarate-dependent taurine dioxygenase
VTAPAPFDVTPLEASFGAVVTGLSLADLDQPRCDALYAAWLTHGLLILPGQDLDDDAQVRFARRFGELEIELLSIGNLDERGDLRAPDDEVMRVMDDNRAWHSDSTFKPVQAKGAVFSARIVPRTGGETAWADMAAAYDALDAAMKARIAPLAAVHALRYGRMGMGSPPVRPGAFGSQYMNISDPPLRPLVKVHPETGRWCLNIGRHAGDIPGLGPEAARSLLDELRAFACQPPRVWTHEWTAGDVVIWDNRRLLHRVLPWDLAQPRDMRHTRLAGDPVADFAPGWRASA